jgi:hypothetical protein
MPGLTGPLVAYVVVFSRRNDSRQMCWLLMTWRQPEQTLLAVFSAGASSSARTWMASSIGSCETKSTLMMAVSSRRRLVPTSTSESTSSPRTYASISALVRAMPMPLSRSSSASSASHPGRGKGVSIRS